MRASTKEWAKEFCKRLDTCISDWTSTMGDDGKASEACEQQVRLVEFVLKRVMMLDVTVDVLTEVEDAALEIFLSVSKSKDTEAPPMPAGERNEA